MKEYKEAFIFGVTLPEILEVLRPFAEAPEPLKINGTRVNELMIVQLGSRACARDLYLKLGGKLEG